MANFLSSSNFSSGSLRLTMTNFLSSSNFSSGSLRLTAASNVNFTSSSASTGSVSTTQYLMRAVRISGDPAVTEVVYWRTVSGSIDTTGAQSQYPTNELSLIKLVKVII